MAMEDIETLLAEIEIGRVKIRNRFVRSATHEWMAEEDGRITDNIIRGYSCLAENNIGLIISGYSYVSPCGKSSARQQGIYDNRFIQDYAMLTKKVNDLGARFFVQIVHGGRQALRTKNCPGPVGPSHVPLPYDPESPNDKKYPKELDNEDIETIIGDFSNSISRLDKAKVDGVQLHCAHGFLLSNFLSPYTNTREDDWGGDTNSRTRIVVEILRSARKVVGNLPIAVKMNAYDGVDGGIETREAVAIAKILDSEGIDAIEVSGGIEDARQEITCVQDIQTEEQEAYFREYSREIKRNVECPVILVGGNRSLNIMKRIIKEGYADMISLSRPLIREPNLITKFMRGDSERATCVSCNECFDVNGIKCNYRAE